MANIVLRSKLANNNIIVDNKILTTPVKRETVQLTIRARDGFVIDANDFTAGYLPKGVKSIDFINSKNSVIAVVGISPAMLGNKNRIIYLPISTKVKAAKFNLKLNETIEVGKGIVTNNSSKFNTSINNNTTTYGATIGLEEKSLIFERTFYLVNGYNFIETPSFKMGGGLDFDTGPMGGGGPIAGPGPGWGGDPTSPSKPKDKSGMEEFSGDPHRGKTSVIGNTITKGSKTIGMSFKVYHTAPKETLEEETHEYITFTVRTAKIAEEAGKKVAVKKEDYKIYSFDKGSIGAQGGKRKIKITGVPGTPFKLMLQDSDKKTYNQKTGTYEAGGGLIQGVIPPALKGLGYGMYVATINVPRPTATVSYSDRLITDEPVRHDKITSTATATVQTTLESEIVEEVVTPESRITISIDTTGSFSTTFVDKVYGPGDNLEVVEGDVISFSVKPTTDSSIALNRLPRFTNENAFTAWSSGNKDDNTADDQDILNDWYNTRVVGGLTESSQLDLNVEGYLGDDERVVYFDVHIQSVQFGEGDNTYKLKLLNFLTLTSL